MAWGRKGLEIFGAWVELFFILFIAIGLGVGFLVDNAPLSYVIIFLFSLLTGSIIFSMKQNYFMVYTILAAGFSLGFIIGNRHADKTILAAIFIAGNFMSYQVLNRKLIKNI